MTEAQIGLLYSIAAAIDKSQNSANNTLLRSFYLMRCKDLTRGYGLPDKHFSSDRRCPKCCIEWKTNTQVKIRSINLSKRQRKRLKSKAITKSRKESVRRRKDLLTSNEIEKLCTFCNKSTITPVKKPQKQQLELSTDTDASEIASKAPTKINIQNANNKNIKHEAKKTETTNVYANALAVFSMTNKNNILSTTIKNKPKIINNNKKKKDKYAGLCQKAVLASAKLKEQNKKQSGLNLFLKPSSI